MKSKHLMRQMLQDALAALPGGRAPICPHFGECGGCEFQNVPYPSQLAAKKAVFRALAAGSPAAPVLAGIEPEIVGSPQEFGYRQRMDYVCMRGNAGLRQRGSHWRVVGLQACPLLGERGFAAFRRARELAVERALPDYDYVKHTGFLRYLVVRQSRGGGVLVSLVTASSEYEEEVGQIARTLLDEGLATSVYRLLQPELSDVSFGAPVAHWGEEHLEESYLGKRFLLGPNTFFQANPAVAERAYAKIAGYAAGRNVQLALDAYSGTGVIAQLIAGACRTVRAVENIPDNVALAHENFRRNGVGNVEIAEADALAYLRACTEAPDFLVVNPPRLGLTEKAAREVLRLAPPVIAYMSCNPLTLLTDLAVLAGAYRAQEVTLYDMFPQTRHWETLVLLTKIPAVHVNRIDPPAVS